MKNISAFLFVLFLAILLTGCDSASNDPDPEVTGRWTGIMAISGFSINVTLNLTQTGTSVTGTGTVETFAGSVSGTHTFPNVTLTFSPSGFADSNYTGKLSDDGDTITGTWTEPGVSTSLTVRK